MPQTNIRRLVTEPTLEAITAKQDGRLALIEAAAGFEGPPLSFQDSVVKALVLDPASETSVELGKRLVGKGELVINVCDYGAKGDWVSGTGTGTDNLAAFNAAWADAVAQGRTLFIPDGKYRFSGEWDIWRINTSSRPMSIIGQSRENTWLVTDFFGAGKSLIRNYDPANVERSSPTSYANLQFRSVSRTGGTNPVFMNNGAWSESTMDHVKFGPSNNTHFRGSSLQNIRAMDTVSYYGGRNFLYKATNGITFTVTTAGSITSSAPIFTAADVGMLIFISPTNSDTRIMYRIATVIDGTSATIDTTETPAIATARSKGNFDAALATILSGSTTLTANADCFVPDDVGRVIYVRNALTGPYGSSILRATIVAVESASQVTLDVPATRTATKTPFAQPVIDIFTPDAPGLLGATSTDVKWTNLHVEAYAGLGLGVISALQFHINDQKIHGEHDPVDERMSTGMAWLEDVGGVFSGEFDGGSQSDCRMFFSGMNDTLSIPFLSTRRVRNEPLFIAEDWTENGGFVGIGTLVVYRFDAAGPEKFVVDRGNAAGHGRKIAYLSTVTMVGGTVAPRIYTGMGSFFTPDGRLIRNGTGSTGFDVELGSELGARVLFEDYGTRKYSMGNVAGGGTTFNLVDETSKEVRWQVNIHGDFAPGGASTQNLGSSANKWKDFFAERSIVGGVSFSTGTGSPEGVLTAPRGSEYVDSAGAPGAVRWGKKSGAGSTGWVALW